MGHIVLPKDLPGARVSRLLGRLQLHHKAYNNEIKKSLLEKVGQSENSAAKGATQEDDEKLKKRIEEECSGYVQSTTHVTIKATIDEAAVVVWAAPENKWHFDTAGEVLLVLRLLVTGEHCLILVPHFDFRFPFESAVYVRKTMLEQWSSIETRKTEGDEEEEIRKNQFRDRKARLLAKRAKATKEKKKKKKKASED